MAILTGKIMLLQWILGVPNVYPIFSTLQPCPTWAMGSADCSRSFCTAYEANEANENISELSHFLWGIHQKSPK
jgi:hypothetical protein